MEILVQRVKVQDFMDWLEKNISQRYENSLISLKMSFYGFYNILKSMAQLALEIIDTFEEPKPNLDIHNLFENCVNIIQQIINDHSTCIELQFCVNFLENIHQKIALIHANIHPLLHIDFQYNIQYKLEKLNSGFELIQESIHSIQKNILQSLPILKQMEDTLTKFKYPIKLFLDQVKEMKCNIIYDKYIQHFNLFINRINLEQTNTKGILVRRMIQLIKESCINQLQMETILDIPIKLCQIIKNKGKKILNDDLKIESQNLIIKYVNILIKPDFIQKYLISVSINELIELIELLQNQIQLIQEFKKNQNQIFKDEIQFANKSDILLLYNQWQKFKKRQTCLEKIKEIEENEKYQNEIVTYKQSLMISYKDVKNFSEILYEFQLQIVQFQKLKIQFNNIQINVQNFFLKEYSERVQLSWSQ